MTGVRWGMWESEVNSGEYESVRGEQWGVWECGGGDTGGESTAIHI